MFRVIIINVEGLKKKTFKVWIYLELGFNLRLKSFARKMSST